MTKVTSVKSSDAVFNPKKFIENERIRSTLKVEEINCFLESNPDDQKITHQLLEQIITDPILKCDSYYYDKEKNQEREITARKIKRLSLYMENDIKLMQKNQVKREKIDIIKNLQLNPKSKFLVNKDLNIFDKRLSLIGMIDPQLSTRVGIHLGLFGNCIKGNGTDSQIRYWLQERGAIFLKQVYGCFAMTELGHGSNVAALETTATYDLDSDTFQINTPSLTATKWWIGGAAHSATHAVVYARLIVKEKDYGVKTFIVPLRDNSNFQLLPGIIIGDIGKKMGRDGIDNGWIQFKNVLIPREYLLSRFVKVIPNQESTDVSVRIQPQLDQVSGYSALLSGRVNMVMDSFRFGSKFVTIATRYAVGRQQFVQVNEAGNIETQSSKKKEQNGHNIANVSNNKETQLIDYSLHQYRVLPQLAIVYLISPAAHNLMSSYYNTLNELYEISSPKSDKQHTDTIDKNAFSTVSSKLKNLFISSASLKATNTWLISNLIDELRQCCGGHGYSQYNAFGKGYNGWVVQCTWEGDNNILSLTSAKSILKKFVDSATKGKFDEGLDSDDFDYLDPDFIRKVYTHDISATLEDTDDNTNENLETYIEIWKIALIQLLIHIGKTIQKTKDFDQTTTLLVTVSKFHAIHYMLKTFYTKLKYDETSHITDQHSKDSLWNIFKLFSVYFIDKYSGQFQQFKILKPSQISSLIQPKLVKLLKEIRTDCIKLTDAFELPDAVLNSPIGYFDGDIYHNYFNTVTANNPPESDDPGKPPYHDVLTSMLSRGYEYDSRLGGSLNKDILEKLGK